MRIAPWRSKCRDSSTLPFHTRKRISLPCAIIRDKSLTGARWILEMRHPSLSAAFVPPAQLTPRRTMEPYVECWCGSGKKWKWCHKHRDRKPPVNIHEQLARLRKEFAKGYCSHPDASSKTCSARVIRAHTVQRRGGLSAIAENGHVISAMSAAHDIFKNDGKFVPRRVGIRSASTFMGFCNRHDTAMFRPVESGPTVLTPEACFVLSFRAIAYEHFTKQIQLRSSEISRKMDCGMPFEIQIHVQNYVHFNIAGARRGLSDTQRWKDQYDEIYRSQRFEDHHYFAVEFSQVLPVVGCGGFHPEYDFEGNPLQKISRGTSPHQHVTFNLSVLGGKSVVLLGLTERTNGPAEAFLRSFGDVPDQEKPNAVIRLAFEHIENIYISPIWWRKIEDKLKNALILRMGSGLGIGGVERKTNCLGEDGLNYTEGVEVSTKLEANCL